MIQQGLNKVCGVYSIQNRDSGKRYVGSSIKVGERFVAHISDGRKNSRSCIHRAIREYGVDAFDFTLIESCDKTVLRVREKHWIEHFDSCSVNGFNSHPDPTNLHDCLGGKQSNVTIDRRVAVLRGKKRDATAREHIRLGRLKSAAETPVSEETRRKLSIASSGRRHSTESIAKILATKLARYVPDGISPEARAKIHIAKIGHTVSEATRAKLRKSLTGKTRILSPEHIEQLRANGRKRTGIPLTDAHRASLREAKRITRMFRNADYIQFMWLLPFRHQLASPPVEERRFNPDNIPNNTNVTYWDMPICTGRSRIVKTTRTCSPESNEKRRFAMLGFKHSPESVAKAVEARKKTMAIKYPHGYRMSKEARVKISEGNIGKTQSLAARLKMSITKQAIRHKRLGIQTTLVA